MAKTTGYKNAWKNDWRKWWWREAARRVGRRRARASANVLYLGGEKDLDRRLAVHEGFNPNRLVLVESDKHAHRVHRDAKKSSLHKRLSSVLIAAAASGPVDVLMADYCCGFTEEVRMSIAAVLAGAVVPGGCVGINMMRGRENGESGEYCKAMREAHMHCNLKTWKHRGYHVLYYVADAMDESVREARGFGLSLDENNMLFEYMGPALYSYRSGKLRMDSVVFTCPGVAYGLSDGAVKSVNRSKTGAAWRAQRAVVTMRDSGQLPGSPCR